MAGDDPDLSDLARRIEGARRREELGKAGKNGGSEPTKLNFGGGLTVGIELVAGVVVGAALGYLLDYWLGTRPFLTILMFLLGTAAGMLNAWRHLVRIGMVQRDKDGVQ